LTLFINGLGVQGGVCVTNKRQHYEWLLLQNYFQLVLLTFKQNRAWYIPIPSEGLYYGNPEIKPL